MYIRCDAFLNYCDTNLVLTPLPSLNICWQVKDPSITLSYLCTATYVLAEQVLAILEALEVFLLVHNFCGSHHATTVVCATTTYYQLQLPRYITCITKGFPKSYFKSIFSHLALWNGVVSSFPYFRSHPNLTLPLKCFPHLNHFPRLSFLNQKYPCFLMNQVFSPCLLKRSLRLLLKR